MRIILLEKEKLSILDKIIIYLIEYNWLNSKVEEKLLKKLQKEE